MQHDLRAGIGFVIARMTPRIWDALTSAEKTRIDLLVKGMTVGAAYTSGVNNADIKASTSRISCLSGYEHFWKTGAPNFRGNPIPAMLAARIYFGSAAAVVSFLNGFDRAAFAAQAQAQGLTNLYHTFQTSGPNGDFTRPTTAQVEAGITDWAFARNNAAAIPLSDAEGLIVHAIDMCFARTINTGLNNGVGVEHPVGSGKYRGRMMAGQAGLPNAGQSGMVTELDYSDGFGPRSAMSYSMADVRIGLEALLLGGVGRLLNRKSAALQAAAAKMNRGMIDYRYKSDNGYLSYAKGGAGNSEDWTTAAMSTTWGLPQTFGLWFDVLKPWLDG